MMKRFVWILSFILCALPLHAQEEITASELILGALIEGTLDDSNPRHVYVFPGSRGEVVEILVETVSGDLDPVLSVFDSSGTAIFHQDDFQGSRDLETRISFEKNDRYFIVIGRFGYALGSTKGQYQLSTQRIGVLSSEGSTLQYGVPVTNTITNMQPQIYYTFEANAGEILNIEMVRSSGTLDPLLQVVDSNRFLLIENDDADGSTRNARISNLVIRETGTYIIVATRYGEAIGESAGNFALVVNQGQNSGLGNNRQVPATILMGQTLDGDITEKQYQRYYRFEAERDQIVTITMDRTSFPGQLDAYLILTNAGYIPLVENDDGGGGSNARISNYRIPANGYYNIIATRFDRAEGQSHGEFKISLIDEGQAFDLVAPEIPRLLYGTTVPDAITDEDPESLYVFWGTAGEAITISMDQSSGTLDPVVELLDSDQVRMLRDDDGGANKNARIEGHQLPYTGVYYIRATRYEGSGGVSDTTGAFNLVLTRVPNN